MTTFEKNVKSICDEVYDLSTSQIVIDLVQEEVEELLNKEGENSERASPTRDEVGSLSYQCGLLLEVYNPKLVRDIDILTRLRVALNEWATDIENTNKALGIPKES